METTARKLRIGRRQHRRSRPQPHRSRRRAGLAAGRFRRPPFHGRCPDAGPPGPPGSHPAPGQGPLLPAKAHGLRPEPAEHRPDPRPAHPGKESLSLGRGRGQSPGLHHPESRPHRAGDQRTQPAASHRRQQCCRPYAPAGVLEGAFRSGRRPPRFPPQQGGDSELAPAETVGKLLDHFREPGRFDACSRWPRRSRRASGRCSGRSASKSASRSIGSPACGGNSIPSHGLISEYWPPWLTRDGGRRRSCRTMRLFEHPDFDQATIRAAEPAEPLPHAGSPGGSPSRIGQHHRVRVSGMHSLGSVWSWPDFAGYHFFICHDNISLRA